MRRSGRRSPQDVHLAGGVVDDEGRCCVAEGRAGLTPPAPVSDCECEFGEDRLEPAAGLGVESEFVVAAA